MLLCLRDALLTLNTLFSAAGMNEVEFPKNPLNMTEFTTQSCYTCGLYICTFLYLFKHCVDHTCRFSLTARGETVSVFTFRKQSTYSGSELFFF